MMTEQIFSALNKERKTQKAVSRPMEDKRAKRDKIKKGIGRLVIGSVITTLALFYLIGGLEIGRVFFLPAVATVVGGFIGFLGLLQIVVSLIRK